MSEFVQICVGGVVVGSIYALIALGFSLVYRVTGAINLSQGGFSVLAALIGYTLVEKTVGMAVAGGHARCRVAHGFDRNRPGIRNVRSGA